MSLKNYFWRRWWLCKMINANKSFEQCCIKGLWIYQNMFSVHLIFCIHDTFTWVSWLRNHGLNMDKRFSSAIALIFDIWWSIFVNYKIIHIVQKVGNWKMIQGKWVGYKSSTNTDEMKKRIINQKLSN